MSYSKTVYLCDLYENPFLDERRQPMQGGSTTKEELEHTCLYSLDNRSPPLRAANASLHKDKQGHSNGDVSGGRHECPRERTCIESGIWRAGYARYYRLDFFLFVCHFTHCTVNCKKTIYSDIELRYQARYTKTKVSHASSSIEPPSSIRTARQSVSHWVRSNILQPGSTY